MREHVPGFLLENIVHHALSQGVYMGIPGNALMDWLTNCAQEAGLRSQAQRKDIRQASAMLTMLRDYPIYQEIQEDELMLNELLFSWTYPIVNATWVIDLLNQDRSGD